MQAKLPIPGVRPSKRSATRHWRECQAVVAYLEKTEAAQAEDLKATREALKLARANHREAENILGELLDAEDPTLPGVRDADRTLPGEA